MEGAPSYTSAPNNRSYDYRTYRAIIRQWTQSSPQRPAFVEYKSDKKAGSSSLQVGADITRSALTCEDLEREAMHFAKYLLSIGLKRGDLVLFCMGNTTNLLVTFFGIAFAGGICVNYAPRTEDGSDVIEVVKEHSIPFVVTDMDSRTVGSVKNYINMKDELGLVQIIYNPLDETDLGEKKQFAVNLIDILKTDHSRYNDLELPYLCADDILLYFQSSGSTGLPKLIGHSHNSYHNSTFGINDVMQLDQSSIFYCDRPFTWGVGSPRTFVAGGSTRVFTDTTWAMEESNIETICTIIAAEKCTHVYCPAYQIVNLLKRPELARHFTTVQCIKFAGERFKKHYTEMVKLGFCKRLVIWYGSTEAAGVSAFVSDDLDLYEDGIIGKPLAGVEMKIVDDDGVTVPKGQSGELCIRSVYRFLEYKGQPGLFRKVVDSRGWLKTGDTAHIRDDGNYVMDGRFSEEISCGTFKFFPWEVEQFLRSIPGVISAVGVPVPDTRLNNVLCACVVIDKSSGLDMEVIRQKCDGRFMVDTMDGLSYRPKYYIQMDRVPTSATGKLDRRALADAAANMLDLKN